MNSKNLKTYYFLLLDSYSVFEVAAVTECFNLANRMDGQIRYIWQTMSVDGTCPSSSSGMSIDVDSDLINLSKKDTVVIFGGCNLSSIENTRLINWIRRQIRFGVTFGAVNSGSFSLGKAGTASGLKVAVHWNFRNVLREMFPDLDVSNSIIHVEENHFTCAGGAVVLEMTLQLIERDFGKSVSNWVADQMILGVPRTEDRNQLQFQNASIGKRNLKVAEAIEVMRDNLEIPLSTSDLASQVGITCRQLERLFARHVGTSPKSYYVKLRAEHARLLLLHTDQKVFEVAISCGFATSAHFSKIYKKHFGIAPSSHLAIEGKMTGAA